MELKRQLGLFTAVMVIIADMIGTGIFMTTGNVLGMTESSLIVLILWVVGGFVAIAGALCYSELATMWPDVGGEYIYLKKTYGSLLPSFLTGWISLVVGFSAPVAVSALTAIGYIQKIFPAGSGMSQFLTDPWMHKILAAAIVLFFGAVHIIGVKPGARIQNILTVIKVVIVVSIIGFGFYMVDWTQNSRLIAHYQKSEAASWDFPTLGLSLLMIMFSYSGWNAATYIGGEINKPERNLPRAMFYGTVITSLLYIAINVVFIMSSPGEAILGKNEIGAIATINLFGAHISKYFNIGIVIVLLSAISVQIMIGPRIYYVMAKDRVIFKSLESINPRFQTPVLSIAIQVILSVIYIFIFEDPMVLLIYMGFALQIFPFLAIMGLLYLRYKMPNEHRPYKVHFYPLLPLLYLIFSLSMMIASLIKWTKTSCTAIVVVLIGIPIFYIWKTYMKDNN